MTSAYCLKCKVNITVQLEPIQMKNFRPAGVGHCPHCGTKVYKIGWDEEALYTYEEAVSVLGEEYFY
jgi:hypothetical protein